MFEIGNSLREARVRQGLGYPELELATKIRAKYLKALEDEEFSMLPGNTYVKGFLRTYADHLGLDGQLYVDEYASRFAAHELEEPLRRPRPRTRQRTVERRAVLLALLGIAALAALVMLAWKFGGSSSPSTTPPAVQTPPASLTLRGVGKGSYVVVRRNSASGRLLLQGTVEGGSQETLDGTRFYVFARSPGLLRVTLGGKPVALPSAKNLRVLVTPQRTTRVRG